VPAWIVISKWIRRATSVGDASRALSDELTRRFIQVREAIERSRWLLLIEIPGACIPDCSVDQHDAQHAKF
jgi:hypothetical protein